MEAVTLRAALPEDAGRIAPVHRDCWHQAYTGLVPLRCLDELDVLDLVAVWRDRLEQPELATTLALAGEHVVGMATVASHEPTAPPPLEELRSLYVLREWWGQGVGRRLLDRVLADRPAALWVFEANARARRFYARSGWRATGQARVHDWAGLPEVRLVRDGAPLVVRDAVEADVPTTARIIAAEGGGTE